MEQSREIHYTELRKTDACIYDKVEMKVPVKEIYEVEIKDLSGITFQKRDTVPYVKDFSGNANFKRWNQQFDLSNWHFFMPLMGRSQWVVQFCAAILQSFICWKAGKIWVSCGISVWILPIKDAVWAENCFVW
ncbi:hypothetical protein PMF13cell1_02807 [Blautia producta]|uniref:Uncharacterized protein n=1 Tax=Blautia producta TaxID=33035 RepID=A0A4P6LXD8_9FIRM|nr:hypothetical protein PMF13cell1_02807 [Blautia producta]